MMEDETPTAGTAATTSGSITVPEAARRVGRSERMVRQWMAQGHVAFHRNERGHRHPDIASLDAYVATLPAPVAPVPEPLPGVPELVAALLAAHEREREQVETIGTLRERLAVAEQRILQIAAEAQPEAVAALPEAVAVEPEPLPEVVPEGAQSKWQRFRKWFTERP